MVRDVSSLTSSLQIGGATGHVDIDTDGTLTLNGDASVWRDMLTDLSGKRLNSTSGKVEYDWDNNGIIFSSGGVLGTAADMVHGNLQINHDFLVGAAVTLKPHVHWFQSVVSHTPDVLDTTAFVLSMRYRVLKNGYGVDLTVPSWTTITLTAAGADDVFDETNAGGLEYINQITKFPDIVVNVGISDIIQFQMTRTDALAGVMVVTYMDLHGQIDSLGSPTEYTK